MIKTRVFTSVLLAAAAIATVVSAAEPRTTLLEKKFQIAAATYQKYDVKGQTWYCNKGEPASFTRLPGWQCLTEPQLRESVRNFERNRNPVQRPLVAGTGQGSVG